MVADNSSFQDGNPESSQHFAGYFEKEEIEKRHKSIDKALVAGTEAMAKTLEEEGLDRMQFTPVLFLRDDFLQYTHSMVPKEARTQVMATLSRWLTIEIDELNSVNKLIKANG